MAEQNIFVPESVYIFPPNGGVMIGTAKKGKVKVGMQAEINGKILEITALQIGEEVKNEAEEGEKCGFLFVCKGIKEGEIGVGEEIELFEPKE